MAFLFGTEGLLITLHYRLGPQDKFIEKWVDIEARDGRPYFLTVLLELENLGDDTLLFNTGFVSLGSEMERLYPRSLPELWTYLVSAVGEEGTERVGHAIFDSSVSLGREGRMARLLIFNYPDEPPKGMLLNLGPLVTAAGDVIAVFPLRRMDR